MPIEPVKIPQNVYIEDRIVGPLTLRQVIICAVGCGFSYAAYSIASKAYGSLPLPLTIILWVPGALSIVFAFLKFNDLTMLQMLLLTLERMSKAPVRVWTPRRGLSITIRTGSSAPAATVPTVLKERDDTKFDKFTAILDQQSVTQDETASAALTDERMPTETEADITSTVSPLPVNKARISVTPLKQSETPDAQQALGGGRVSLFHDIHPA